MKFPLIPLFVMLAAVSSSPADAPWFAKFEEELPLLGHRNWIVIADSAYPLQSAPGIETIYTGADQLDVMKSVLNALSTTNHVRPIIHLDAELDHVSEDAAAGVTAYREALKTLFWRREIRLFSHDEMIAKLADASRTFHVLILKTKMKVPYTSVFLQLDCGYWSAEDEQALRSSLKKGQK